MSIQIFSEVITEKKLTDDRFFNKINLIKKEIFHETNSDEASFQIRPKCSYYSSSWRNGFEFALSNTYI